MSIYGIGTDLIDIRRIDAALQRHGDRFALRVLGPQELVVWQARRERSATRGVRYVATRFSAKEAFSKAIGLGIRQPMSWRACEILNAPGGRPYIQLHGALQQWFESKGLRAQVSVTDESDYATTFVIVEQPASP